MAFHAPSPDNQHTFQRKDLAHCREQLSQTAALLPAPYVVSLETVAEACWVLMPACILASEVSGTLVLIRKESHRQTAGPPVGWRVCGVRCPAIVHWYSSRTKGANSPAPPTPKARCWRSCTRASQGELTCQGLAPHGQVSAICPRAQLPVRRPHSRVAPWIYLLFI